MPGPRINTYTVTRSDGTLMGPYSLKGLKLQHGKGIIAGTDLVHCDGTQNAPHTVADLLAGPSRPDAPAKPKTALPPAKARSKAALPPKKERPAEGHVPSDDDLLFGAPEESSYSPATAIPSLTGRSLVFLLLSGMILILLFLHAYITSSISESLMLEADLHSRLADFRDMDGMLGGFLLTLSLLSVLSFLFWLYRAASNAFDLTGGRFSVPPSTVLISCFIPVYNLWAVYSQTRYIVNASTDPSGETLRRHRPAILLWWLTCLGALTYRLLMHEPAISDIQQAKSWFEHHIYGDIFSALALTATMLLVLAVSASQKNAVR